MERFSAPPAVDRTDRESGEEETNESKETIVWDHTSRATRDEHGNFIPEMLRKNVYYRIDSTYRRATPALYDRRAVFGKDLYR